MIVYVDDAYKCHISPGEGLTPVETDAFDGKRPAYIEGYRYVPSGEVWTRSDGAKFTGEMVAPWKPWEELDAAQRAWEREQYDILTAQLAAMDEEYVKGVNSL